MAQGQPLERLRKTFGVVDNRPVTVTVLAEEDAGARDAKRIVAGFEKLKEKYQGKISETRYFFGRPEREESAAKARWVHDMDQAVTADLLILSRGYFSSLTAAMQRKKRAFTIGEIRENFDLPGMIQGNQTKGGSIRITETAALQPYYIE
jgi:hypothetical protein